MHEGLSEFLALPRRSPIPGGNDNLHFIIDQERQPHALQQLYSAGAAVEVEYLLHTTEFAHLAEVGPVWFCAKQGSELAQLGARLCEEHQAGIAIRAENSQHALAHARWLLKVNDSSGGQSLATYYLPELWAAMAMTAPPKTNAHLLGSWSMVASPALNHIGDAPGGWLAWLPNATAPTHTQPTSTYFPLAADTKPAYLTLRWLYWIDKEHAALHTPSDSQLPGLIDNLNTLVTHRVADSRHLLKLANLARGPVLSEQPAVMRILRSSVKAFEKVAQLRALMDTPQAS